MARKGHGKQFKIGAAKLVLEDNILVIEVSKELSGDYNISYRWISEYEEYGESVFPDHGNALHLFQYELKKFKKEHLELKKNSVY